MTRFEIRYARKVIQGKDYRFERMKHMNEEIEFWMKGKRDAKNNRERNYCGQMATVYKKKYQYYLNKTI